MRKKKVVSVVIAFLVVTGLVWWFAIRNPIVELAVVREVDPSLFLTENLAKPIQKRVCRLSDGSSALCYVITIRGIPHEHAMGPWVPKHVTDGKDQGGIWIKDGKAYDVDGEFVANLAELYGDPEWNLVREDGSIRVTDTREAFELAARPDVDPRYHNYVVESPPEVVNEIRDDEKIYCLPVAPVYRSRATRIGHNGAGVAFNGVTFDPPAPIHDIVRAHTIAPFDDFGGHVNPHAGYHYHAATGHTKEVPQRDGHAPMLGYGLDGFGIYAHLDEKGNPPKDLDECRGHYDDVRGYHYHVGAPGDNQIILAFRGVSGVMTVVPGD